MEQSSKIVQRFLSHRNVTVDLISKIEEEHYEYKPTPTSMSAKELSLHMLESFYRFAAVAKEGNPSPLGVKSEPSEASLSDLAQSYTEKTKSLLQSLTEEELNREIDLTNIFGAKLTGKAVLNMATDHEIHHKGALFIYVREIGHTDLPLFVSKS